MLVWGLILLLLTATPAPAQTLKELFVDAQRSKLTALQEEVLGRHLADIDLR